QAEDGIRDRTVTGVQTCALPISELWQADDPAQRAAIWAGRKSAFAAVGRISPAYIVQDGVVPRSALGSVLDKIARLSDECGVKRSEERRVGKECRSGGRVEC